MAKVRVQTGPFDLAAEFAELAGGRSDIGGVGSFIGIVRDQHQGRTITELKLEHYPGMTERALADIAAQAESRWPLQGCTIIHRVGAMRPGEQIVLVLTASAHRAAALAACSFLIDWLKTAAPFWKQESYDDGSTAWVAARDEDDVAAARWQIPPG